MTNPNRTVLARMSLSRSRGNDIFARQNPAPAAQKERARTGWELISASGRREAGSDDRMSDLNRLNAAMHSGPTNSNAQKPMPQYERHSRLKNSSSAMCLLGFSAFI